MEINKQKVESFILIDRVFIRDRWRELSPAAKAVYPVISSYFNNKRICFLSGNRIGFDAGLTEKTVAHGVKDLQAKGVLSVKYIKTRNKRFTKQFCYILERSYLDCRFFCSVIRQAVWSRLTPSAKAIYIVMISFSDQRDREAEQKSIVTHNYPDYCECRMNIKGLSGFAGVSTKSFNSAYESLRLNELAEFDNQLKIYRVYLTPDSRYLRKTKRVPSPVDDLSLA